MIRRIALFVILAIFCAYSLPQAKAHDIQVAFLYQHNVSDFGWTFAHDSGRLKMHEALDSKYDIYSEYFEVAPGDSKINACIALVDGYASRGFNLIVYTSSTYNKCSLQASIKYPSIKHLCIGGSNTTDNLAWAFAKIYQVRYLSGMIAGAMTETNNIGYLAAVKNPQVRYNLNAFYLGLKRTNPDAKMNMYWANTFLNVTVENYGLVSLLNDYDVDVVSYQTSIYAAKFAHENDIMSIGYSTDARVFYGEKVLTSLLFDWGTIYTRHVESLLNGNWSNQSLFLGMDQGAVRLAAVSQSVRSNRQLFALINEVAAQFAAGNDTVYCGPDVASYSPALANGCLSSGQILGMSFVLPGINDLGVITVPDVVYEELYVDYDDGLGIAFMVIAAVCIAGTVVLMILTGLYKHAKVMISASPLFCFLIQGAAIVGYSAVFTWTGRPSQGNCVARSWLVNIGFILLYAALFAKSWRIWVIFRSAKTLRARVIKDKHLLLIGGIFLVPEIVILLVWSGLEPMDVAMMESPLLTALQRNMYCNSTNALTFQLVLIIYKAVVLIFGMFIAIATRKVRSDFNESKQIAFSIYNIFFVCVIILPLLYFLPMGYQVSYALANIMIIWIPSTTLLLLFIPKLKIAINNPNQSAASSYTSTNGSNIENLRVSQKPPQAAEKSSAKYSTGTDSISNNTPNNNKSSTGKDQSSSSSSSDD